MKNIENYDQDTHDVLTGLFNRRSFIEEMARLDSDLPLPLSLILADINGLRLINDEFGMESGDRLIVEVADLLKGSCREEDFIARIGGGEFCILMPKADKELTQVICKRIDDRCEQYDSGTDGAFRPDISLGHQTRMVLQESMEDIVKDAEMRMYRHKLLEAKSAYSSIVTSIISILRVKYEDTVEHDNREKCLCRGIGLALGISNTMHDELDLTSILHDIGKIAVSDAIINKHAKLTKEEKREIQKHPEIGYRIIQSIREFQHISDYVLFHHEKWDGTGYPRKLTGEEIPLISRIISIVDAYVAMTMNRPYREALPEEYAINEIKTCAGTQFDPAIARIFIEKVLGEKW